MSIFTPYTDEKAELIDSNYGNLNNQIDGNEIFDN